MNVFLREMKATRKSLIIWTIGILFMVVSGMAKYEGMGTSKGSLNELISQMPKSLQAIMGTGSLDLSTVIGYYGILFVYLLLMAAIHALMLGANIIAKEERDKTAEFLMAKPISRTRIVTAKLSAALSNIVIFNVITLVLSVVMVEKFNSSGESLEAIYLLVAGMFLLQLLFLMLGTGLAALLRKPKLAAPLGTAVLLTTYILSIAVDLNEKLEPLQYLTPFKFYEAKRVIIDGALDPVFTVLSLVIIILLTAVTYVFYKKRDLNV